MRNQDEKIKLQKKSTLKNLCEKHLFFGCTLSFLCHFLTLFSSTPILGRKKFASENGGGGGGNLLKNSSFSEVRRKKGTELVKNAWTKTLHNLCCQIKMSFVVESFLIGKPEDFRQISVRSLELPNYIIVFFSPLL